MSVQIKILFELFELSLNGFPLSDGRYIYLREAYGGEWGEAI